MVFPIVNGSYINNSPIFSITTKDNKPWSDIWGATLLSSEDKWVYPAYFPFIQLVLPSLKNFKFDPLALEFIENYKQDQALWTNSNLVFEESSIPLFDHQKIGIAKALAAKRLLLLWEMGTGKTRVLLTLLCLLKKQNKLKKVLIVCPNIVIPTWERQLDLFAPELNYQVYSGTNRDKKLNEDFDILLLTYGTMRIQATKGINKIFPDEWKIKGQVSEKRLNKQLQEIKKIDEKLFISLLAKISKYSDCSNLYTIDYDTIIFDEAHVLGNPHSDVTQAAIQLASKAYRRYLLTGTAGDTPLKYFALFKILHPHIDTRNFWQFKQHYTVFSENNPNVIVGYKNIEEINKKVNFLSYPLKKKDCLTLPSVLVSDILISLGPKQKAKYNQIVQEYQLIDEDKPILQMLEGANKINKLLQLSSGFIIMEPDRSICNGCEFVQNCVAEEIKPYTEKCKVIQKAPPREIFKNIENPKLEVLRSLVENIISEDNDNKIIIWATYLPELDDIEQLLANLSILYVRVDGSSSKKIKQIEDTFQNDSKCRIYLGQSSSGIGLTLTAGNYTIYYSLPWDRVVYNQSFDRNVRIGQTRKVTAYRLLMKDTLDEFVGNTLLYKDNLAFSLSEKIKCAFCDRQAHCGANQIRPFKPGCKYLNIVDKPIARAQVI